MNENKNANLDHRRSLLTGDESNYLAQHPSPRTVPDPRPRGAGEPLLPGDLEKVADRFLSDDLFRAQARLNPFGVVDAMASGHEWTVDELSSLQQAAARWAALTDD